MKCWHNSVRARRVCLACHKLYILRTSPNAYNSHQLIIQLGPFLPPIPPFLFLLSLAQGGEKKRDFESEAALSSKWVPVICQTLFYMKAIYDC